MVENIIYFVCLIITIIGQCYLSYKDYTTREIKNLYLCLLLYIPTILGSIIDIGFNLDLVLGFIYLALFLYVAQIIHSIRNGLDSILIGSADILMAPIYTSWFGFSGAGVFLGAFVAVLLTAKIRPIFMRLVNKNVDGGNNSPILVLYQCAFIIAIILKVTLY